MTAEERKLEEITAVLVALASGDFSVRAPRDFSGDSSDVLAYLANETAEEVHHLVQNLHQERQELVEAKDRLHQAEKLAALGELAGGVAHELNQPLTVIQTLTEVLLAKPEVTIAERRKELELIQLAIRRMGRIVGAIRTFGRGVPASSGPIRLVEPAREALALMGDSLRAAGIEVVVSLDEEVPAVRGNSDLIQQVVINLLSNSRDALESIPLGKDRRIEVEIAPSPRGARLLVRDTGGGIPQEHVARIFDPFYTTKAPGRGTGLGLAISHGIVSDCGGELHYQPTPTEGAEFIAEFPAFETSQERVAAEVDSTDGPRAKRGNAWESVK